MKYAKQYAKVETSLTLSLIWIYMLGGVGMSEFEFVYECLFINIYSYISGHLYYLYKWRETVDVFCYYIVISTKTGFLLSTSYRGLATFSKIILYTGESILYIDWRE